MMNDEHNGEHMITDVEDENADENAIDGSNGNGDDEADDNVNDGEDMAGSESGVLHGEIVSNDEAERALAIHGVSEEVEALYAEYEPEEASEIRQAVMEAKEVILGNAVETGRALSRVKSLVKHGKWEQWVKLEFGMSKRTAQNFIALANVGDTTLELFGREEERKILSLPQTINYQLGDTYVPDDSRADIIEHIVNDEYSSEEEILDAIKEAKEAAKAERQSHKKGGESADGEGGGGDGSSEKPLTTQEQIRLNKEANRKFAMWNAATSIASGNPDIRGIAAAMNSEMGTGPYHRMKPEEHQAFSEMLLKVLTAYLKDPESVEKLRPVVPPLPEPKVKKAKEPKAAKAPKEAKA